MAKTKSPRSPSISLDDAINKATKVYERERRHAAPTEVVAQDIGYKSANNGTALAALASLRYYGLLERPKEGHLAVTKDVETYLYAPNDDVKRDLLKKWMSTPPIFLEIIEKYSHGLPSDATLRFDLISRGFAPPAAESLIPIFKKSAEFAGLYDRSGSPSISSLEPITPDSDVAALNDVFETQSVVQGIAQKDPNIRSVVSGITEDDESDRIPVRLPEGRRAWLIIPSPFFEADKIRLKAQIDLLLTDEMN